MSTKFSKEDIYDMPSFAILRLSRSFTRKYDKNGRSVMGSHSYLNSPCDSEYSQLRLYYARHTSLAPTPIPDNIIKN